ncbi:MAG TPA: hypothetical protein VMT20_13290, partial [Terriglobia bacterium]|nr:hypothetical protein [Terriglobia bacterium]
LEIKFQISSPLAKFFDLKPTSPGSPPVEARVRFLGSLGSFPDFARFFSRNSGSFGFVFERQFGPFLALIHL